MYRALLAAAAACTLLTSRDGSVGQLKDVEIVAVKRACCGSGLIEFLHRVTVRTSEGRQLDLYAVSLSPKRDPLPAVGDRCDVRYTKVDAGSIDVVGIKHRDMGANLALVSEYVCGGRRITPGIVDRKPQ